jgi:hypothetical protein
MIDYIKEIPGDRIVLNCPNAATEKVVRSLGGRRTFLWFGSSWTVQTSSQQQLAACLSALRDAGVAFAGGTHGWPPSAVFSSLREQGLATGHHKEIVWSGPWRPIVRCSTDGRDEAENE